MFGPKFRRKYALTDQGVRNVKKGTFWTVIVNLVVMGGIGILYFLMMQFMAVLTDGSYLCSVNIKIDFDMSYDEFKQMLVFLTEDERITTINYTKIDYDPVNQRVVGYATLLYYFLDSDAVPYEEPVLAEQDTGKATLFE